MTPGDDKHDLPHKHDDDEEILDLDLEEVTDFEVEDESSSASAIEGVEMLDFLEDDEDDATTDAGSPSYEPTIDMSSAEFADGRDAEIDNLDELEVADVADLVDDAPPAGNAQEVDAEDLPSSATSDSEEPLVVETVDGDFTAEEAEEADEIPAEDAADEQEDLMPPADEEADEAIDADETVADEPSVKEPLGETESTANEAPIGDFDFLQESNETPSNSDLTVAETRERTAITERDSIDEDGGPTTTAEPQAYEAASDNNIEEEFRLRDDDMAVAGVGADSADAAASETGETESAGPSVDFAQAVAPKSSAGGSKRPKKSALPIIIIAVVALLLVVGATGGGLYVAGLLPGFGSEDPQVAVEDGDTAPSDENVENAAAGNDFVDRINSAEEELRNLYREAKTDGQIDGDKLQQAQQLLSDLEANDAEVFAEEPIQQHMERFNQLAADYKGQAADNAEQQRRQRFTDAFQIAEANRPVSLDEGMLEEARKFANEDEQKLIAVLEKEVSDYQAEQASADAKQKQQQAFREIASAAQARDEALYREMIDAYIVAYPNTVTTSDLKVVAETDPPALKTIAEFNRLLDQWSTSDMRKLPPEQAAAMVETAEATLDGTSDLLPGADQIRRRLELLRPVASRGTGGADSVKSLQSIFTSGAAEASFVFTMQDGTRHYTAQRPTKQGDSYVVSRLSSLGGETESVELPIAEADRSLTGVATVSATADRVAAELAKIQPANWESPILKSIEVVAGDEKLDPVVKTQWLVALATTGSKYSAALQQPLQPYRQLQETGVEADFNWTDPEAAAKVRPQCQEALAALPMSNAVQKSVAGELAKLGNFNVPTRLIAVGVVKRESDSETAEAELFDVAPKNAEAVAVLASPDGGLTKASLGEISDDRLNVGDSVDAQYLRAGRVIYADVPSEQLGNSSDEASAEQTP